jgi:hypothetical protein
MRSKGVGTNSRKYGIMEEQTAFTFKISQHITYMRHASCAMRHFHNTTHPVRRNLVAIVCFTHFISANTTLRPAVLTTVSMGSSPTVSKTGVLVLLGVPVHSENACYHQFKIFCLPVRHRETQALKYKLQNYTFVCCTCERNGSLTLREENRLGIFHNRILRNILAPDREKTTE